MGELVGIFVFPHEGGDPVSLARASFEDQQIAGDRSRREGRQVLVAEADAVEELGLVSGDLREQISVKGVPALHTLSPGDQIRIGEALLEVSKPCGPCLLIGEYNGREDREEFRRQLEGRRGMFVSFVGPPDASISVGDSVEVLVRSAVGTDSSS